MNALPATVARRRASGLRRPARAGLWAQADFVRLWSAQSISLFGSEITVIALPLTAVLVLGASPAQMGLLAAAGNVPFLLVGLLAGVWVDRLRYRPVLVAADLGRAVLLGSIPVAAAFGVLRIEQLFVVAFLAGTLTVFFDVAYQSYLPELVTRDRLAEGNGKLEASKSVAEMAGPMVGSGLLQIAAAPFAIGVDAISFLLSAAFLRSIRRNRPPAVCAARSSVLADVGTGIRLVLRHPLLRPIAACSATMNLFYQMVMAVYILYLTTGLQLAPGFVGVTLGVGSLGGLAGALIASPVARRFGTGKTLIAATVISGAGGLMIAVSHGLGAATVPALIGAQVLLILGVPIYNINQLSLRQAITPADVRGRVNATNRFLVWGTMPVGSLLGGLLGQVIGVEQTIVIGAVGMLLAGLWIAASRVRTLSDDAIGELAALR
jgi:MFS family permease